MSCLVVWVMYSQVLPVFNLQWEMQLVFCFERERETCLYMYV